MTAAIAVVITTVTVLTTVILTASDQSCWLAKACSIPLLQAGLQRPEAPTVSFAPSQARYKAPSTATATASSDKLSSAPAGGAEAAGAASKQGSVVQEPQGLQVGLSASHGTCRATAK